MKSKIEIRFEGSVVSMPITVECVPLVEFKDGITTVYGCNSSDVLISFPSDKYLMTIKYFEDTSDSSI